MSKRDRNGGPASVDIHSEESKDILSRMSSRARGDWPAPEELEKKRAESEKLEKSSLVAPASGKTPYMSPLAELLYLHHDRPHKDCRYEWWYINGALGRSKVDPTVKYSFFAAFFRLNAMGDTYCHAVNWAVVEERFEVDAQTGVERAVPGTSRYHTSSLMDPITPTILLGMMKAGLFKSADEHLTRQLRQIYEDDCVPAPDLIMRTSPQAFPDPYSFSPSPLLDDRTSSSSVPGCSNPSDVASPVAENVEFGTNKSLCLLQLEMDGNTLKSTVDLTSHCPTTKALLPPVYDLHLAGNAMSTTPEGVKDSTSITLDVKYTPATSTPVLHGRNGVVTVGNMIEDDMFYYFTPQCNQLQNLAGEAAVKSTVLTIGGTEIELMTTSEEEAYLNKIFANPNVRPAVSNVIWMDHEFGAAISESTREHALLEARKAHFMHDLEHQWEWAALQLEGLGSISLTVLKDAASGAINDMFGIFQPAPGTTTVDGQLWETFHADLDTVKDASAPQPIKFQADESVPVFTSTETGKKFPNAWTAELPNFKFKTASGVYQGLTITMRASFPGQEFITLPGKPSYWEGRITVTATPKLTISGTPATVRGTGFMECHGHVDPAGLTQLFTLTKMMLFDPVKMSPKPAVFTDAFTRDQRLALARTRNSALATPIPDEAPIPEDVAEMYFDVLFAGELINGDNLTRPGQNAVKTLNAVLLAHQRVAAAFETTMLPQVRPMIQMAMSMVPGPKPPAEHVEFLSKAVAVYSFLHHFYGPALLKKAHNGHPLVISAAEREKIEYAASLSGSSAPGSALAEVNKNDEEALASYEIKRELLWADVALGWLMRQKRFLLTGTSGSHRMSGADAAHRNINSYKHSKAEVADTPRDSVLGPLPPRAGPKETILCALVEKTLESLVLELESAFYAQAGTSLEKSYPFLISKRHFHPMGDGAAAPIASPPPQQTHAPAAAPVSNNNSSTNATSTSKSAKVSQLSASSFAPRAYITIPEDEDGIVKGTLRLPIPSEEALKTPATDEEITILKHDLSGQWSKNKSLGKSESISSFLGLQSVSLAIRMMTASLTPELDTYVDEESKCIATQVKTTMVTLDIITRVNGEQYNYNSTGRGTMKCRACLFDNSANKGQRGGRYGMVAAQEVPNGPRGIEFKYVTLVNSKDPTQATMREVLVYYNQEQVDKNDFSAPTGVFRQYFTKKK